MIKHIILAVSLIFNSTFIKAQSNNIPLYIGSYTSENGSKGIYEFEFNTKTADAKLIRETPTASPSYIIRNNKFLLAANELTDGNQSISSFEITKSGLKFINKMPTDGSAPCHVVLSKDGKFAVVSNYLGGALNLYAIGSNGEVLSKDDTKLYNGKSINKERQEASHIHSAFFGIDNLLYVSDLGADKIYILDIKKNKQGEFKFEDKGVIDVKIGAGPRHIAFHPSGKYLYSILEMTGEIEVFEKTNNKWNSVQIASMRKSGFKGESGAADVKLSSDSKFLYATDRLDANTITVFAVEANGKLKQIQVLAVEGKGPRNFNFTPDQKYVLVANQLTDEIVIFSRDQKTGKLSDTKKRIKVSKPVCVLF